MTKQRAICLACGKPRPTPKKDVFRDIYDRPMTFCNDACYTAYIKKQPKA